MFWEEGWTGHSSIRRFTSQMITVASAGPVQGQEFLQYLSHQCKGLKYLSHILLFLAISRELDLKWKSQNTNWYPDGMLMSQVTPLFSEHSSPKGLLAGWDNLKKAFCILVRIRN